MNYKIKKFVSTFSLLAIVFSSSPAFALTAKELQKQKLQQQQAEAQALANQKAAEAAQMQKQIAQVDNQINQTTTALNQTGSQISETESSINDLSDQVAREEENLKIEKEKLSKVISQWYMEGDTGLFTLVVGSNNISEVVSKQQYYDAVRQQLNSSIVKLEELKAQLSNKKLEQEKRKNDLVSLQKQQSSYRQTVIDQKTVKTNLLNMTVTEQKQYLAMVSKLQSEVSKVAAEIYAERQRNRYNESIVYGSSSYPFSDIDAPDPWNFLTRECTSYAAWYWNVKLGKKWYNTQPGRGSARYWGEIARTLGYSVSSTPRVGAIVSWYGPLYSGDQWGHVAIVESVNSDGTVDISEFNWSKYAYTYRRNVHPGNYGSYSYIY